MDSLPEIIEKVRAHQPDARLDLLQRLTSSAPGPARTRPRPGRNPTSPIP